MRKRAAIRGLSLALAGLAILGLPAGASAQEDWLRELLNLDRDAPIQDGFADLPVEPEALAAVISRDIESLRQLNFRESIAVSEQTIEEFGRYVDAEMARSLPPDRAAVFGRVVEKLGLYRGPTIEDAVAVIRNLATSQVAAYYDPEASAFHVVLEDAPMSVLAPIYAHELYHGLQDQYWDLEAWLLDGVAGGLNDDELFARQAVVEGEATYVMTLWMLENLTGRPPSRFAVSLAVWSQAMLSAASANDLIAGGLASGNIGEELRPAVDALDDIPPFMIEGLLAAYLKGMTFIHAIAGQGWQAVAGLYADPPRSSEQILHPEKYLRRDDPVTIEFPDFGAESALADWRLIESNVIGEFQWRLIFGEFGFGLRTAGIAAGWDGDRFAVLESKDQLLLLLLTAWDSPQEAQEFGTAYTELLALKYPDTDEIWTLDVRGSEVLIVEGGERARLPDYLDVIARAVRSE